MREWGWAFFPLVKGHFTACCYHNNKLQTKGRWGGVSQSFSYGCKAPVLLWDDYQRTNQRGKKGGNHGKSSSPDHHITGCLFSFSVKDCKRAFCVASQRLQDLCYSVMLIILKLPRCSWHESTNKRSWEKQHIHVMLIPVKRHPGILVISVY